MSDLSVTGAAELAAVGARLKAAGAGGLRRELLAEIRKSAKPLTEAARANAAATLPRRGGLADEVARSKFVVRTRATGGQAGVRIIGSHGRSRLSSIDRGVLRHPTFGNREAWVTQQVKPGWFTAAAQAQVGQIREHVVNAVRATAAKI